MAHRAFERRTARPRWVWRALIAAVLLAPAARAGTLLDDEGEPVLAAARLSDAASLVIVIDDADDLRETEAGQRAVALLAGVTGAATPLERAWGEVAAQLSLDEGSAFDAVLGRRVAILIDDVGAGASDWAVVTLVPKAFVPRVVSGLRASPRRFSSKVQVFGLEGDRLEMVILPGDPRAGLKQLVLAPRSSALLDRLVTLEHAMALEPVGNKPAADGSLRTLLGTHQVALAVRADDARGAAGDAEGTLFATARAGRGGEWKISMVGPRAALPAALRGSRADPAAAALLEPDTLLAWSGSSVFVPGMLGRILVEGGLVERLGSHGGGEVFSTVVRETGAESTAVSVVIRTDALETLIAHADATLGRALRVSARDPGHDFAGRFPSAVRTVSMTVTNAGGDAARARAEHSGAVVWSFAELDGLIGGPDGGPVNTSAGGWCVISSAPADPAARASQRQTLRRLERGGVVDATPRLFTLHARPRLLVERTGFITPGLDAMNASAALLRGVESISIIATPVEGDRFRLDARLVLAGPGAEGLVPVRAPRWPGR